MLGFWRRRYLLVVVPYVVWTAIYFVADAVPLHPMSGAVHSFTFDLVTGAARYHLYFLLVTMQLYLVFPLVMGYNRGRYFLLTGQKVSAQEAKDYGVVNEVLPPERLLPRAWEIARQIMQQPELNRRYTRILLTEVLRRQINELLPYGLALEGLALIG